MASFNDFKEYTLIKIHFIFLESCIDQPCVVVVREMLRWFLVNLVRRDDVEERWPAPTQEQEFVRPARAELVDAFIVLGAVDQG